METTSVFLACFFFSLLYFQVLFEEKNSAIMKGKERKRTSFQKHGKLLKVSVCVCALVCVFLCVLFRQQLHMNAKWKRLFHSLRWRLKSTPFHTRVNFFLKISLLAPSFGPVTCSNHDLLKIQFMTAVMSPLLFFLCTFFRSHFKCYLRLPLSSLWHLSVRTQTSLVSFFVPVCFFVFKTFVWDK